MEKIRGTLAIGCGGCALFLGFLLGIAILLEWLILPSINPIRQSERAINESLLKETPIGTTRKEVKAFLKTHNWGKGGHHLDILRDEATHDDEEWLGRSLGSYTSLTSISTTVYAEWHFDKNGRLDYIDVHKAAMMP